LVRSARKEKLIFGGCRGKFGKKEDLRLLKRTTTRNDGAVGGLTGCGFRTMVKFHLGGTPRTTAGSRRDRKHEAPLAGFERTSNNVGAERKVLQTNKRELFGLSD